MDDFKAYFFLSVYGLVLLLGCDADATSSAPTCGPGQCSVSGSTPRVQRVILQKCNSSMDSYCLHGECILIADIIEPHCKCDQGYVGHRCAHLAMIYQPMSEEHIVVTVVCVALFIVGIAGIIYFSLKWYRNKRNSPPEKKYQEVQMA